MLAELRKCLKCEEKDKAIFDIIWYGSSVKGKSNPQDIDLAVIFRSGSLKERLEKIQNIKAKLNLKIKIDLKGLLWEELFSDEFFAKSGIFLWGISIFTGQPFSKRIGFFGAVLFIYNLRNKTHTEKVKFNYLLSGRNSEGIIKKLGGQHLTAGAVEIPAINSLEFEEILNRHKISFIKKEVLMQR